MQDLLTNLINKFASSWLYVDFMSKLPEGLNNPYLDFLLVVVLIAIIIVSVVEIVQGAIWRKKRLLKAKELQAEMAEKKSKEDRMMEMMEKLTANGGIAGLNAGIPDEMWHDSDLGILNKNAFSRDFKEVPSEDLGIIFFDVNNLKKTNDSLGHKFGDILLKTVAGEIMDVFGTEHTYRKGGDEFIYMVNGEGYQSFEEKLRIFRNRMVEHTGNDQNGIVYETAAGYCINDGSMSKDDVLKAADAEMYKNKEELKATKPMTNVVDLYAPTELKEEGITVNVPTEEKPEPAPKPKVKDMTSKNLALFGDTELTDGNEDNEIYDLEETNAVNDDLYNLKEQKEPEQILDANAILKEKMSEQPTSIPEYVSPEDGGVSNMFTDILSGITRDAEEKKKMQELSEQEKSVKSKNLEILEKKVKSSMVVEGSGNTFDNAAVIRAQEKELERRREEARREEERARKRK